MCSKILYRKANENGTDNKKMENNTLCDSRERAKQRHICL